MHSFLSSALFALCLTLAGQAAAQEQSPPVELTTEQQAEVAAAAANVALIATQGAYQNGAEPAYPDEERALGHHGRVEITGVLGADGRLRYAIVSRSSRAPALDAIGLASAIADQYTPALDAAGNAIPVTFTTSRSFYSFTSSQGVGAAMYTCPQFVLDMDWFKATWTEEDLRNHYFYLLVRGLGTVANLSSGRGIGAIESNESYMARWNRAIETCRSHPNWRFAQAMRPEGDYIDNMARNAARRRN
ncbi:MAG: TonB family protein [Terricaulis sp.]